MSSSIDRPASNPSAAATPAVGTEPLFDAQRLDVYRAALEFQVLSASLLPARGQSALRDQLDRASASIVLCIAEGAGRSSRPDKARFYCMARGSAAECAAVLDIAMARGLCSMAVGSAGRVLLVRGRPDAHEADRADGRLTVWHRRCSRRCRLPLPPSSALLTVPPVATSRRGQRRTVYSTCLSAPLAITAQAA